MSNNKENCLNEILKELIGEIKDEKVALFFGTGISKHSGNLLANEIVDSILCSLEYNGEKLVEKEVKSVLIERTKQFEDFMNRIYDDVNHNNKKEIFSKLFSSLYCQGKPNNNHYAISQLIKEGFVKNAYTTNFDLHLENAYEELYNKKLETCILRNSANEFAPYVKLHGCASKVDNIDTLLTRVASKEKLEEIKPFIEELLIYGEHETALFMGYSFSDVYDIVKKIEEISESNKKELKKIFIISHEKDKEKYEIYSNCILDCSQYKIKNIEEYNDYSKESKPPKREIKFENFKITILRYNTSDFIEKICNKFNLTCKDKENSDKDQLQSELKIKKWVEEELEDYYRLLIGWRFNYESGQEYFLSVAKRNKIFRNFRILEEFFSDKNEKVQLKALKKALKHCETILEDNEKSDDSYEKINRNEIINKTHKAVTLISMGEFLKAKRLLESLPSKCNEISNSGWKSWLKLNVNASRLYLEYYKVMSNNYSKKELEELREFIIKNELYYNKIEKSFYKKHEVNYKNQYILAALKTHAEMSDNNDETYFKDSIKFYENKGRVEYLAFVYMEYAKFLKKKSDEKCVYFTNLAKELFENLGYTEYTRFCDDE